MKIINTLVRVTMALALGGACIFVPVPAFAEPGVPHIIQAGFDSFPKGAGFDSAVYIWQKGGLLEGDRKATDLTSYLRRANQAAGGYLSYEVLRVDAVGRSSQVIYLALNFKRGAVYGRFLLYRTDKDWVVQDMDFSTRPEAIMPWLALAADKSPTY